MQRGWFWLLNGLLILLYLWAMGEETAVSLQVINGRCIAAVPERHIGIDCPQMGAGSQVGFYATQPATTQFQLATYAPLRWLAPHTAWANLSLFGIDGQPLWQQTFSQTEWNDWQIVSGNWMSRWGELRGTSGQNTILVTQSATDDFILTSTLRRAEDEAGLLLIDPNGQTGLVFVVDGMARRGVWWEWENGRLTQPIIGIPFQKPLLQQAQSLLRLILTGHQAALLLLMAMWVLKKAGAQGITEGRPIAPSTLHSLISNPLFSQKAAVLLLTLLTFGLTTHIASDVLARVPHVQDSLTYLFQANTIAQGDLWVTAPTLPQFFEQEFLLVQDGRWFGKYPVGYPAVLAIGVLLKAPWLVNPILATLTVPLLYQLGRRLYNGRIGLFAAGLMTLSPFFLFLSGSHMAHAAELFWLVLFMVGWHKTTTRLGRWPWALAAGLTAGMAFLTRQLTAVAITAPFFLLTLWQSPLPWQNRWKKGLIWLAGLLPLVMLLFAYQAAVTGDPFQDPRLLFWPYDQLGFGEDVGEAPNLLKFTLLDETSGYAVLWQTDPSQPPRGHTPQRGLHNVIRNWQSLQENLFGWLPLLTFGFIWLTFILKRPSPTDWTLLTTIAVLVAAEIFYWHSGIMYGPRYLYGSLPALLLLTARGAQRLAQWLGGRRGVLLTAVPLLLLILGNILGTLPTLTKSYRGFNFVAGDKVALVETAVPLNEKALIFVDSPTGGWWEYGELFMGNEVGLDGRFIFARDLGDDANLALRTQYPERTSYRFSQDTLIPLEGIE